MYSFQNNLFIAWGGNKDLADRIKKRISSNRLHAMVGGDVVDINDEFFLGRRIIDQMNSATEAIILVQPEYDDQSRRYRFRENLMFEWGYLINRMPRNAISVFIIGADRNSLPSDLQGAYTYVVPEDFNGAPKVASWICREYRKENHVPKFSAFDVFTEWPKWKVFLKRQVDGSDSPQPTFFGQVLISSFPPALYSEDLAFYENLISQIDPREFGQNEYATMAKSIIAYVKMVRDADVSRYRYGDFSNIKMQFSYISGYRDRFLAAVAQNFMGLCLRHEAHLAKKAGDLQKSDELVIYARDHFLRCLQYFEGAGIDFRTKSLWLGYVYSNLYLCSDLLKERSIAEEYLSLSIAERKKVLEYLSASSTSRISNSFRAEYLINCLRMANLKGHRSTEVDEAFLEVERRRNYVGGYVWGLLERELSNYV